VHEAAHVTATHTAGFARSARIVAGAFVGVLLCQTPMVFLSIGAFVGPLRASFGWDFSTVYLAVSASTLALALASPFAGALLDRWGVRNMVLTSTLLLALTLMSLYFLTDSLWHLLGTYALLGVLGAGANTMPYARILVSWFDRRRGLALGIAMAALGLGGDVAATLTGAVMANFDWRAAYLSLGLLVLIVAWPTAFWLSRDVPGSAGADGASDVPGLTRAEAMRTRTFWMLALAFALLAATLHGLQMHLMRLLGHNGLSPAAAAPAVTAFGAALVIGRIGCGFLFDHRFAPRVALGAFLCSLAGLLLVGDAATPGLAIAAGFLAGLGPGAETALIGYLVSRYFGLKSFGFVYGCVFGADMFGTAVGIYGWGLNYDLAGSYRIAQVVSVAGVAAVCLLLYRLGPYPGRAA
jgi:MFS family permease